MLIPSHHIEILRRLGIDSPTVIGTGVHSTVYRLDEERIVKISSGTTVQIESLAGLLADLEAAKLPFQTPRILDHGKIESSLFIIEAVVSGSSLRSVFPGLDRQQKESSIRGILEALRALHRIPRPFTFGEQFLATGSLTALSWRDFVEKKCRSQFELYGHLLASDVPHIEDILERFIEELAVIDDSIRPSIVHGDLFFPNIMALPDGTITGLIDFSDLTLFGDAMLDLVSLAIFARQEEGRDLVNRFLVDAYGDAFLARKRLYTIFYAFRFAGCKANDPETYQWCVRQFMNYSNSGNTDAL